MRITFTTSDFLTMNEPNLIDIQVSNEEVECLPDVMNEVKRFVFDLAVMTNVINEKYTLEEILIYKDELLDDYGQPRLKQIDMEKCLASLKDFPSKFL